MEELLGWAVDEWDKHSARQVVEDAVSRARKTGTRVWQGDWEMRTERREVGPGHTRAS